MALLLFLIVLPALLGCFYWVAVSFFCFRFFRSHQRARFQKNFSPFVSLIKPLCGLEKNLHPNLSSACTQHYPDYEIIFAVQSPEDPSIAVIDQIIRDFPHRKIKKVVDSFSVGPNGRLSNIYNATAKADGDIFVYTDSDMFLPNDYLATVVAPLADPKVGVSGTLYRGAHADSWHEKLELLSLNTDFIPSVILATETKASIACLGGSQVIRREVLEKIGGLKSLSHYLVEDFELGLRVAEAGYTLHFEPMVITTEVHLKSPRDWWRHQVYWDQNTRAANPVGFFFTWLVRGVPFAVLYAFLGGPLWPAVLFGTLSVRCFTALLNAKLLEDKETPKYLWLLPLRDVLGIFIWFASLVRKKVYWKGRQFIVQKGQMVEIKK